jgi:trans-aconitate 2-methyltransferase
VAWQDPGFARAWDQRHLTGNPSRAEHLAILLDVLGSVEPGVILDLGCGSGLVAAMVLESVPGTSVFGVDSSPPMLALARERLERFEARFHWAKGDLRGLESVDAPMGCRAAVAVQSLHHLAGDEYARATRWTFEHLAPGGWFFIIDRLAIPAESLYIAYHDVRARQDHSPNPSTFAGYLDWLEANGDRPLAVQTILGLLEHAGFTAAALEVRADRGMLIARRPQ